MPTTPRAAERHLQRVLRRFAALGLLLAAAAGANAQELRVGGTGAGLGTLQLLADAYAKVHPEARITVMPSMGSSGGIKAVLSGALQLAVSSRALNDTEVAAGARSVEYGRTPFVFATAAGAGAGADRSGLSAKDLVDIYAGRTASWPDGRRIRLVLRPVGDSDTELIKSLSATMREAATAAEQRKGMAFTVSDQETAASIERISGALGPSTLAQIISEKRPLQALALDGVVPDAASIADGRYPLLKTMLIVTGPTSPAAAREFIAFVRSEPGRAILRRTGHWVK